MSPTSGSRDAPLADRRAPRPPGRSAARPRLPLWRKAVSVVLWMVVAVCGLAYAVSLAVPLWFQVHDQRLLVVTSGSMSPKFDAGDAVVLRAITDDSELKVNQIISFWPVGTQQLVTHRIVALEKLPETTPDPATGRPVPRLKADGTPKLRSYVITKGDANPYPDVNATPVERVRGVVLAVHAGWGWVLDWAGSSVGRAVMLVPPLLALAILELLAVHDRGRSGRGRRVENAGDRRVDELLLE
ncbi:signal peptidase I [Cellulomonas sp. URHD0024]|uniref:signal peptidase I n=1 Tax=Cellulomonas sp. URHD0024 TaxID=1302620 RepID=UPI001E3CFAA1|nr:signal peptidase I [Cellulomonas sp. URHD0024]